MKKTLALTCGLMTIALLTGTATADMDYYVRNTAAGAATGLDWANAFGSIDDAWAVVGTRLTSSSYQEPNYNVYIEKSLTAVHSYGAVAQYLSFTRTSGNVTISQFGGLTPGSGTAYTQTAGDVSRVSNTDGDGYDITHYTQSDSRAYTINFNDMEVTGSASAASVGGRGATVYVNANHSIFESTSTTSTDYVLNMGVGRQFELDMDRCLVKGTASMAGGVYVLATGWGYDAVVNASNTAIVNTGDVGIYADGRGRTQGGKVYLDSVTISDVDLPIKCGVTGDSTNYFANEVTLDNVLLYPNDTGAYLFRNEAVSTKPMVVSGDYNAFYGYSDTMTDPGDGTGSGITYDWGLNNDDDFDGDPGLKDDGFHLLATSPMIGAGATDLGVDYDGELRPNGTGDDIGADEYVPVPEPTTMGLLGLGFAGMAALRRRRKRA